jgi:hypothetical protein
MFFRVIVTICVLVLNRIAAGVYSLFQSPTVGAINAQQVNDSATSYALSRWVAQGGIESVIMYATLACIAFIWLSAVPWRKIFPKRSNCGSKCSCSEHERWGD